MHINKCHQSSLLYILVVGKNHDGPGVGGVQELFDDPIKVNGPVFALLGDSHGLGNAEPTCLRKESRVSIKFPKTPEEVTGEEGVLNSECTALF